MTKKEQIHRSFHSFKANSSTSSQSPHRYGIRKVENNQRICIQQISLLETKGSKIADSPSPVASKGIIVPTNLNSLPKPLPKRVLTPRNAPNDLFRKLEDKLKASKNSSSP